MPLIEVGAEAPDFSLLNDDGQQFRLSDLRSHLMAMLVFYPKDFTPGCTDQLIHIRKNIDHIRAEGVEPMGINPGDAASHKAFRREHALNFDLLIDEGARVASDYGAIKPEGNGIQRSVVVVGRDGSVVFAEQGAPPWQRVLMTIKRLASQST